jgi:hypothetical protein
MTMDRTKVAMGIRSGLPQVLVDLQAFFEFTFELDEQLERISAEFAKSPRSPLPPASDLSRILHPLKCREDWRSDQGPIPREMGRDR